MVDLVNIIINPDMLEKIYKSLTSRLSGKINKRDFQEDLYHIVMGAASNDWVYDFEYGPTIQERIRLVSGFADEIERLIKRFKIIEKYYPPYEHPETGDIGWIFPSWLSQFTDKFNVNELKEMAEKLRAFEAQGKEYVKNGAKPRLSGRKYYIQELMRVFEKHTGSKAIVNKTEPTDFGCFVMAFFANAPIYLKNKTIKLGALYNECQKIRKEQDNT